MKNSLLLILFAMCYINGANAQHVHASSEKEMCGFLPALEGMKIRHAERYALYQSKQLPTRNSDQARSGNTLIIPVVFHVLHNNDESNISDAQVHDALRILNEDFNGQNNDLDEVVSPFHQILGNANIQFVLARRGPNGACFNGITRTVTTTNPTEGYDQWEEIIGGNDVYNDIWSHASYLNIIVAPEVIEGAAGYTFKPNGDDYPDFVNLYYNSIYVEHTYIGSIGTSARYKSRVLTHEVGHWLNLSHIWGDGPIGYCGDDFVEDTPYALGSTNGCDLDLVSCDQYKDNVQNFMDYSYCSANFTEGQALRMRDALEGWDGGRYLLSLQSNLIATGVLDENILCNATIKADKRKICVGESVFFQLENFSNPNASYAWAFQGGNTTSSSLAIPVITYNSPGIYPVQVTIFEGSTQRLIQETQFITVEQISATQELPLVEGYVGEQFIPENWNLMPAVHDLQWNRSAQYGTVPTSGNSMYANTNVLANRFAERVIQLPVMDMTDNYNVNLSFDVAYTRYSNRRYERLEVLVSPGCGQDFVKVYAKQGQTLQTEADTAIAYQVPQTWRREMVNLNDFSNKGQVRVQFKVYGGAGNLLFVDNIELIGIEGTPVPDFSIAADNRCVNQVVTFQDSSYLGFGWTWNFGAGATTQTAVGPGPHQVVYSNVGTKDIVMTLGNNQTKSKSLIIDECLSIDQLQSWTLMFPNPAKTEVTIKSHSPIQQIQVIDLAGRVIHILEGNEADEIMINTELWALGTYIVEIRSGHGRHTLKLVKE